MITRDELTTRVWHADRGAMQRSRTIDIHVRRLRAKLGARALPLETVIRVGYRFRTQ